MQIQPITVPSRKAILPIARKAQTEEKEIPQIEAKDLKIIKRIDGGWSEDDAVEVQFAISGKIYSGFIITKTPIFSSVLERTPYVYAVKKENKVIGYWQNGRYSDSFILADGRVARNETSGVTVESKSLELYSDSGEVVGILVQYKKIKDVDGNEIGTSLIKDVNDNEIGIISKDKYLLILKNIDSMEFIGVVKYTDELKDKIAPK